MKSVKGYSKVQGVNKICGLEVFDLLALCVIYLGVFVVSDNLLVNLAVVFSAYFVLRLYKKGKAPHWSGSVLRFLVSPVRYVMRREREKELFV